MHIVYLIDQQIDNVNTKTWMNLSNTNRLGSLTFGAHCVYRRQKRNNKNTNKTNDEIVTLKNTKMQRMPRISIISHGE